MTNHATRTARAAAGAVLLLGLLTPASTATVTPPGSSDGSSADRMAAPRTRLTFTVEGCDGCRIQVMNFGPRSGWSSKAKKVAGGAVTFTMPMKRTHGMSVTVHAPWEGLTGYATNLVWRYGGEQVGDEVTLEKAVTKKWASACWEGTRKRRLAIPLVIEEVEVEGVQGPVTGTIAFVPTTQSWLRPVRRAYEGVLGSQDVNFCR